MDKTLLKSLYSIVLILLSFQLAGQNLTFTAVSGNTNCDSPNHCVFIEVTGFDMINAFQFAIDYDENVLNHVSTNSSLPMTWLAGNPANGQVPFSWFNFSGTTLADDSGIITICFQPTGVPGPTTVSLVDGPSTPIIASEVSSHIFTVGTDLFLNSATFNVDDIENPVIVCPGDTTLQSNSAVIVNNISPGSVMDNCLIDTVSYQMMGATSLMGGDDASGSLFQTGTTNVQYVVLDEAGNSDNCSFDVNIEPAPPGDTTFTLIPEVNLDCINGTVEICITTRNFNNIEALQVPFVWDSTQLDYVSSNILLPANGIIASSNASNGVAALIWNQVGLTNGLTLNDGDSLFCVQYNILSALDTPIISIVDLLLLNIEVISVASGTPMPIPYQIEDEVIFTQDNIFPTLSGCPSDTTIIVGTSSCGMNYSWTGPTGDDDCIGNLQLDSTHVSGDFFGIGTTTVTYTITDLGGNSTSCSFDVIVQDNVLPTASCPGDTTIMAIGPIVVNDIDVVASDLCGPVTIDYVLTGATMNSGAGNASGELFENGVTTVTYSVTDSSMNVATCSFNVTIDPGPMPEIACPNDTIVGNTLGDCSAVVTNVSAEVLSDSLAIDSVSYVLTGATTGSGLNDVSGLTFNVGITTVTYILTDLLGQTDNCSFTIEVTDDEAPSVTCPPLDAFDNAPGECGVLVNNNLMPIISDNCPGTSFTYIFSGVTSGSGSTDPTGSYFNVGITSIDYSISDGAGNMSSCSVVVWVNDAESPSIVCPMDTTVVIPFGNGSENIFGIDPVSIMDNCPDPNLSFAISGATVASGSGSASGQSFNLGTNLLTYYASDTTGNVDSCSFQVIVESMPLGPLVDCPNDTVVTTDIGVCGAIVSDISPIILVDLSFIQSVNFLIDGATMISDSADASGTFFNTNISTIKYYVEDIMGNIDSCQFTVIVNDNESPIWTGCTDTIPLYVDNMSCRRIGTWSSPVPSDNCGILTLDSTHSPGDTFDLGFTTITYTATDDAMNVGLCEFVIWVRDTFPPEFSCPNDTIVNASLDCSAIVNWSIDPPTDNCNVASFSSTQNPGDVFPVGVTTITYTATDDEGNSVECSFLITVNDSAPPVFVCPAEIIVSVDGSIISDPTGILTTVSTTANCDSVQINFNSPEAVDACDGIIGALQYEGQTSGSLFTVGTDTLSFVATDAAGNSDSCSVELIVLPFGNVEALIIGPNPICEGENVTFNIGNPISGSSYSWTGPADFNATGINPVLSNVTSLNAGVYQVVCSVANGCSSQDTINLDVLSAPDFIAESNAPICSDGSSDLELFVRLNPGSPTVDSWSWVGPMSYVSTEMDPVISNANSDNTGVYTVTGTGTNGCVSSATVDVTVGEMVTPSINSNCDGIICLGESCLLLGTEFGVTPDAYIWSGDPEVTAGMPVNTNQSSILVTPSAPGIYIFNYAVVLDGCDSDVATFVLTVEGPPSAENDNFSTDAGISINGLSLVSNDAFNGDLGFSINPVSEPSNGILIISDDGTFVYTAEEGYLGTDNFSYELCNNCNEDLCSIANVTINVEFAGEECEVPTVITPNGDDKNETLFIDCLETGDFPENFIIIFNEWGDEVFNEGPYQNNWGGTYKGEPLPDGTYFYIFDDGKGGDQLKGALTIFR